MARSKYYNPTTGQWEYADRNPLPTGEDGDILVNENGVWVARQPSRLPAGYQEVEYIRSDGTGQYIDLNFVPTINTRLVVRVKNLYGANNFLCGQASGDWDFHLLTGTNGNYYYVYGNSGFYNTGVAGDEGEHIFDIKNGSQKLDGVEYGNYTADSFPASSSRKLIIFGRYYNYVLNADGHFDLIEILRYEGNVLVGEFVPCRKLSNDDVGLIDTVSNQFFTNAGTGTFLKGADV